MGFVFLRSLVLIGFVFSPQARPPAPPPVPPPIPLTPQPTPAPTSPLPTPAATSSALDSPSAAPEDTAASVVPQWLVRSASPLAGQPNTSSVAPAGDNWTAEAVSSPAASVSSTTGNAVVIEGKNGAKMSLAEDRGMDGEGLDDIMADQRRYSTVFVYVSDPDDMKKASRDQDSSDGNEDDDDSLEVKTVYVPLHPSKDPEKPASDDKEDGAPSTAAAAQDKEPAGDSASLSDATEQAPAASEPGSSSQARAGDATAPPSGQRESVAAKKKDGGHTDWAPPMKPWQQQWASVPLSSSGTVGSQGPVGAGEENQYGLGDRKDSKADAPAGEEAARADRHPWPASLMGLLDSILKSSGPPPGKQEPPAEANDPWEEVKHTLGLEDAPVTAPSAPGTPGLQQSSSRFSDYLDINVTVIPGSAGDDARTENRTQAAAGIPEELTDTWVSVPHTDQMRGAQALSEGGEPSAGHQDRSVTVVARAADDSRRASDLEGVAAGVPEESTEWVSVPHDGGSLPGAKDADKQTDEAVRVLEGSLRPPSPDKQQTSTVEQLSSPATERLEINVTVIPGSAREDVHASDVASGATGKPEGAAEWVSMPLQGGQGAVRSTEDKAPLEEGSVPSAVSDKQSLPSREDAAPPPHDRQSSQTSPDRLEINVTVISRSAVESRSASDLPGATDGLPEGPGDWLPVPHDGVPLEGGKQDSRAPRSAVSGGNSSQQSMALDKALSGAGNASTGREEGSSSPTRPEINVTVIPGPDVTENPSHTEVAPADMPEDAAEWVSVPHDRESLERSDEDWEPVKEALQNRDKTMQKTGPEKEPSVPEDGAQVSPAEAGEPSPPSLEPDVTVIQRSAPLGRPASDLTSSRPDGPEHHSGYSKWESVPFGDDEVPASDSKRNDGGPGKAPGTAFKSDVPAVVEGKGTQPQEDGVVSERHEPMEWVSMPLGNGDTTAAEAASGSQEKATQPEARLTGGEGTGKGDSTGEGDVGDDGAGKLREADDQKDSDPLTVDRHAPVSSDNLKGSGSVPSAAASSGTAAEGSVSETHVPVDGWVSTSLGNGRDAGQGGPPEGAEALPSAQERSPRETAGAGSAAANDPSALDLHLPTPSETSKDAGSGPSAAASSGTAAEGSVSETHVPVDGWVSTSLGNGRDAGQGGPPGGAEALPSDKERSHREAAGAGSAGTDKKHIDPSAVDRHLPTPSETSKDSGSVPSAAASSGTAAEGSVAETHVPVDGWVSTSLANGGDAGQGGPPGRAEALPSAQERSPRETAGAGSAATDKKEVDPSAVDRHLPTPSETSKDSGSVPSDAASSGTAADGPAAVAETHVPVDQWVSTSLSNGRDAGQGGPPGGAEAADALQSVGDGVGASELMAERNNSKTDHVETDVPEAGSPVVDKPASDSRLDGSKRPGTEPSAPSAFGERLAEGGLQDGRGRLPGAPDNTLTQGRPRGGERAVAGAVERRLDGSSGRGKEEADGHGDEEDSKAEQEEGEEDYEDYNYEGYEGEDYEDEDEDEDSVEDEDTEEAAEAEEEGSALETPKAAQESATDGIDIDVPQAAAPDTAVDSSQEVIAGSRSGPGPLAGSGNGRDGGSTVPSQRHPADAVVNTGVSEEDRSSPQAPEPPTPQTDAIESPRPMMPSDTKTGDSGRGDGEQHGGPRADAGDSLAAEARDAMDSPRKTSREEAEEESKSLLEAREADGSGQDVDGGEARTPRESVVTPPAEPGQVRDSRTGSLTPDIIAETLLPPTNVTGRDNDRAGAPPSAARGLVVEELSDAGEDGGPQPSSSPSPTPAVTSGKTGQVALDLPIAPLLQDVMATPFPSIDAVPVLHLTADFQVSMTAEMARQNSKMFTEHTAWLENLVAGAAGEGGRRHPSGP